MKPEKLKNKEIVTRYINDNTNLKLVLDNGKSQSNIIANMSFYEKNEILLRKDKLKKELCTCTGEFYNKKPIVCKTCKSIDKWF